MENINPSTSVPALRFDIPGSDAPERPEKKFLEEFLFQREAHVVAALLRFIGDGGLHSLSPSIRATAALEPQTRNYGFSGYTVHVTEGLSYKIEFTPLQWGGFALRKILNSGTTRREVVEIFGEDGNLKSIEPRLEATVLFVDLTEMEPQCVLLSHLYNYLSHEYAQASLGMARSQQAHLIERFLRDLETNPKATVTLSIRAGVRDAGLRKISQRMLGAEQDPILSWEERQKLLEGILLERSKLIDTKRRVHQLSWIAIEPAAFGMRLGNWAHRIWMRPASNIAGISYRYTIGMTLWFMHTVRSNIGYSIALAIYGPFTFYFITQPLNPHAMWAVGKVRSAYLETVQNAKLILGVQDLVPAVATTAAVAEGTSTGTAAPLTSQQRVDEKFANVKPSHAGMLVGSDIPSVDSQDWGERMSNFKALQIGYEENMEFAARMGRLEQMETQLNYPMIADTAWQELDRYTERCGKILASLEAAGKGNSPIALYLQEERTRVEDLQLYVWDRMLRFILDHPYVVMDISGEQTYRDYYLGRSFIILRNMTEKLAKRYPNLKKPADYKKVERLAATFEKSRVEGQSVLESLKLNSRLFAQKDRFDGRELRSYMKREWEILYLLQMKAQEASNFGLQTYTWSIRNTLWSMQSIFSTKSRELMLLFPVQPDGSVNTDVVLSRAVQDEMRHSIEPLYESAFHLMNLDYVSIRPELSERLTDDIEFVQRKTVIDRLESSFRAREKVFSSLKKETP